MLLEGACWSVWSHPSVGCKKMAQSSALKNQLILALIWGQFVLHFPFRFEASSNKVVVTVSLKDIFMSCQRATSTCKFCSFSSCIQQR